MKWILVLMAVGACEHVQSPRSDHISLSNLACAMDVTMVEFQASSSVTLEIGQAYTITFLPAIDGAVFDRQTSWTCGVWGVIPGNRGCVRDPQTLADQIVSVVETNELTTGSLPSTFEYTIVGSITDAPGGNDVESVLVKNDCP